MKKLINITLALLVAFVAVGCYDDFGTPEPAHVYTDADFEDCEIISIKELKTKYSGLVGASCNSAKSNSEVITDNWVIRGKVISSDESGNIYKSLFIQDGSLEDGTRAAIELRLFASNYTKYPFGSTVYVRLKDLSIGDYRGMISIGAHSVVAAEDEAHTTIEGKVLLAEHIFLGESGQVSEDDILVVTSDNCSKLYTSVTDNYLACLVRFENIESAFTQSASWGTYSDTVYPSYFSYYDATDPDGMFDWNSSLSSVDELWENPPLAYKGINPVTGNTTSNYYYGSSWFTFFRSSSENVGQYVLRVSAYARFKDTPIPADGTMVNLTSIFTQYLNSSGTSATYQLSMSFADDLEIL